MYYCVLKSSRGLRIGLGEENRGGDWGAGQYHDFFENYPRFSVRIRKNF